MASARELCIVTYNMPVFYQGIETVKNLICYSLCPDILLVQEHWFTLANLYLFAETITTHYAYGCSAMADRVTQSSVRWRLSID